MDMSVIGINRIQCNINYISFNNALYLLKKNNSVHLNWRITSDTKKVRWSKGIKHRLKWIANISMLLFCILTKQMYEL